MPTHGTRARLLALLAIASRIALLGAQGGGCASIEATSLLSAGQLRSRLGIDAPGLRLDLGLDAGSDASGASEPGIGAAFRLGALGLDGPSLLFGPGAPSGALRLLLDPTSTASLSGDRPVVLDGCLDSRRLALGLCGGPWSAFALGELEDRLSLLSPQALGAACSGLSYSAFLPGLKLAAIAAASMRPSRPPSGWQADYSLDPASGEGTPRLAAALAGERLGERGRALLALAASCGRLAGPGLAAKLQARESLDPLDLRCSLGASSPGYAGALGERQSRLLSAMGQARLALGPSASITASVSTAAEGRGLRYSPLWTDAGAFELALPAARIGWTSLRAELEAERSAAESAEESISGRCALSLVRRSRRPGGRSLCKVEGKAKWALGAEWFQGLDLGLDAALEAGAGLPSCGLELSLGLLDQGARAAPAEGAETLSLDLPFGPSAFLGLELSFPRTALAIAPASSGARYPDLSLMYCAHRRVELGGPAD